MSRRILKVQLENLALGAKGIEFDGKQDLRTKVMIALFGLFAEVERDLISERTKEGLAAAKAKGALGKSKLDGKGVTRGFAPSLCCIFTAIWALP